MPQATLLRVRNGLSLLSFSQLSYLYVVFAGTGSACLSYAILQRRRGERTWRNYNQDRE